MHRIKSFLISKPVFLYLLPVFFVLHGFMENARILPAKEALGLLIIYWGIVTLLASFFWLIYKNLYKAHLITFGFMAFNFFFGSAHDFLKAHIGSTFIVKYSFILPFLCISGTLVVYFFKRTKREFHKTGFYLNLLLLIFITTDTLLLTGKLLLQEKPPYINSSVKFKRCDTCSKPDIYLIIVDEYAGKKELTDVFSFSNKKFENELSVRGFNIVSNTTSNYNATVYSMASMLNMDYIQNLSRNLDAPADIFYCQSFINHSKISYFFQDNGYELYNYSFFKFGSKNNLITDPFFISKTSLFTNQTFTNRIQRDIGYHFSGWQLTETESGNHLNNNILVTNLTKVAANKKSDKPKFVYTHLEMPHHPYYLDSNGKEVTHNIPSDDYDYKKKRYIEYLIYTNKFVLNLIDAIQTNSSTSPIIILMSDHGFRQFPNFNSNEKYHFMNLNAIHLPNGRYSEFYDGMSNVNQFRILLNSQFGQKLPLLPDSSIFLKE